MDPPNTPARDHNLPAASGATIDGPRRAPPSLPNPSLALTPAASFLAPRPPFRRVFTSLLLNDPIWPVLLCSAMLLLAPPRGWAQQPATLLHSLAAPPVVQTGAELGLSVAVDGAYAVAGAPYDDLGERDSGVVKVFDSTTGALLHVLANPSPANGDQFGISVAISGTRVVVGAFRDDTGATDSGCAYVYDLANATPEVPVATIPNPRPATGDFFGLSVGISGTRVVIGASQDNTSATFAGSAYVYELSSATPTVPVVTLNNPSPSAYDYFGRAVAISGFRVVVGAADDDTGAQNAGSAYVYDLSSATPMAPVATLNNPSPAQSDGFGVWVAISGTRVGVGAALDDTGAFDAGSAYIYDLNSATLTAPVVTLHNPSPEGSEFFGRVAISGTRVVVTAQHDHTGADSAGSAYVYDLSGATPEVPVATLNNPGPVAGEWFGFAVAISGTQLVVGTPRDGTVGAAAGSAYVYDLATATPTAPVATLNDPGLGSSGDRFGHSTALSGTRMVVGAYGSDKNAPDAGSAYVYDLASATPTVPVLTLHNPGPAANDFFGYAVAISGTRVVVGAYADDTNASAAGTAYVYDLASAKPEQPVATLNNPSPAASDYFGSAVAISGTRVVIGAHLDDTFSTDSGSAYVYDLARATPTVPVATLNNPSPGERDHFGYAVAISGARVVVGAQRDDTGAADTGSAYVYDLTSATPMVPVVTLQQPGPAPGSFFGDSVAISGMRVVVGATLDGTGASAAGSAYVYDLASAKPTVPLATLNNPDPAPNDHFGNSVAISGTRVLVGTISDDTGANDAGSAYVYDLASATPTAPLATLNNPSPNATDWFGRSVAIDGTTVAIGASLDDTAQTNKGSVYVFGLGAGSASPEITAVSIASSGQESAWVTTNQLVSVTFTTSKGPVTLAPGSTIGGQPATLTSVGTLRWKVAARMSPAVPEGPVAFSVAVKDQAGNTSAVVTATSDGSVVKLDRTPPMVTVPTSVAEATSPDGALVTYTIGIADNLDPAPALLDYGPMSGDVFPLGTTTVYARVSDAAGNSVHEPFTVTVQDTTAPKVAALPPQRQSAGPTGTVALADFTAAVRALASDAVGVKMVTQSPLPATVLPLGTHLLSFVLGDEAGNTTPMQTTVTVSFDRATPPVAVTQGARSGQAAPAGPPAGTVLNTFGPPAISDLRDLAAKVGMLNGRVALAGIYVEDGAGTGSLAAFQSGGVPGIAMAGVTFKSFLDPVLAPGGAIAFSAHLQGGGVKATDDGGVWTNAFTGTLELALREGSEVPGLDGAKLKSVTSLSLRDGELLALLTLAPEKDMVTTGDDTVLVRLTGAATGAVLLREGRALPGLAFSRIKTMSVLSPALSAPGHGRWHGDGAVVAKVALTDGRTLLVKIAADGVVTRLLSTTDPATPVDVRARWHTFRLPAMGSAGAEFVLAAALQPQSGIVSASDDNVLLHSQAGVAWRVFAREGERTPISATADAPRYASFFDPVVNAAGQVAFLATLNGATVQAGNKCGLFGGPTDQLRLVARLGDPAPDESGTATGAVWSKVLSHALPSGPDAGVVFLAETSGGDTTATNKLALWAGDSNGMLRRLVRTGLPVVDGGPAVTKLTLLTAVPGVFGATRSFNASGSLAVLATFADKSQALLRLDLP